MIYRVTYYPALLDSETFEPREYTWGDLADLLSRHEEYADKEDAPLIGPYALRPGAKRRCNADFESMSLAVFDADQSDDAAVRASIQKFDEAGVACAWYTSWSYPSKTSWRCVVPLSRPVGAGDWPTVRRTVGARFAIPYDPNTSKSVSHAYFLPATPKGNVACYAVTVGGEPFSPGAVRPVLALPRAAPVDDDELFPAPSTKAEGDDSLEDLRVRLGRRAQKLGGTKGLLIERCLAGADLVGGPVQSTSGDPPMNSLCAVMVWALHPQPLETYEALLRPTAEIMQAEGYKVPWYKIRQMLSSAARKKLQDERDNEAFLSKAAAAAARFNAPKPPAAPADPESP